ncbi:hypothetical protein Bsph_0250 [Lysinibacillus sphaericus C3-41]|uniref:Uncharacterized protein n=1 Tax=Lysinibacillus sphaericus (strain C3-41) TaxID=444177 RepID=B1HTY8_LYSSC|nr:hypothetical protein Bsph_0250 [Lysinibacillus sphaericus C3-41]
MPISFGIGFLFAKTYKEEESHEVMEKHLIKKQTFTDGFHCCVIAYSRHYYTKY